MNGRNSRFFGTLGVVLVLVAVATLLVSWLHFAEHVGYEYSSDAQDWGLFGDFIGGLAGTVVALLALVGLAVNMYIQGRELDVAQRGLRLQEWRTRALLKTEWMLLPEPEPEPPTTLAWRIRNVGLSPCILDRVELFVNDERIGEADAGDAAKLLVLFQIALVIVLGENGYPGNDNVRVAPGVGETTVPLAVNEYQAVIYIHPYTPEQLGRVFGLIRQRLREVVHFRSVSGHELSTLTQFAPPEGN